MPVLGHMPSWDGRKAADVAAEIRKRCRHKGTLTKWARRGGVSPESFLRRVCREHAWYCGRCKAWQSLRSFTVRGTGPQVGLPRNVCVSCERTAKGHVGTNRAWEPAELRILRQFAGKWPLSRFAQELGRTETAVEVHLRRIGLSPRPGSDSLVKGTELCAWLGFSHTVFAQWQRHGLRRHSAFVRPAMFRVGTVIKWLASRPEAYDYLEIDEETKCLVSSTGNGSEWDNLPEPPNWKLVQCTGCERFNTVDLYASGAKCSKCSRTLSRWAVAYTDDWPGELFESLDDVPLCERFPTHEVPR